jgi:hypothetical protein
MCSFSTKEKHKKDSLLFCSFLEASPALPSSTRAANGIAVAAMGCGQVHARSGANLGIIAALMCLLFAKNSNGSDGLRSTCFPYGAGRHWEQHAYASPAMHLRGGVSKYYNVTAPPKRGGIFIEPESGVEQVSGKGNRCVCIAFAVDGPLPHNPRPCPLPPRAHTGRRSVYMEQGRVVI